MFTLRFIDNRLIDIELESMREHTKHEEIKENIKSEFNITIK